MPSISAIVITHNEENMISNCLDALQGFDEIVVVDNSSTDHTAELAKRAGAHVIEVREASFAESRNAGLKAAKSDWILYVDADERLTPALAHEIREKSALSEYPVYAIRRQNVMYGQVMQHGGWEKDSVVRLFKKTALRGWKGDVHEHAEVEGETGELKQALVHFTHRNMQQGLEKTAVWTGIEAQLIYQADKKKITFGSMFIGFLKSLVKRVVFQRAYKDGQAGLVEAFVQAMNRFIVLERVWELQQEPTLEGKYDQYEKQLTEVWGKQKDAK